MGGVSTASAPGGAFASFLSVPYALAFRASHGFGYVGGDFDVFDPMDVDRVWAF